MMTWEEKLSALQVLADTSLRMRAPGNWYVDARGREVGSEKSAMLVSDYGNGTTPQEAVENDWKRIVDALPPMSYIVIDAMRPDTRKHCRWNGFMWKEVAQHENILR